MSKKSCFRCLLIIILSFVYGMVVSFSSALVSSAQPLIYQVRWISHNTPTQLYNDQVVQNVNITIKNTSDFTWQTENSDAHPVRLSYHWVNQAGQVIVWDGARSGIPGGDLAPGQQVTFKASVVAPHEPGYYTLYWDLVQEGVTWFSWQGAQCQALTVHVIPSYGVQWISHNTPTQILTNQVVAAGVSVTIKNNSNFTWQGENSDPNPIRLSYHWVDRAGKTVVWDGVRSGLPGDIAPGQKTTFLGSVIAPSIPGYYTLYWDLVQEEKTWFSQEWAQCQALSVHVKTPYGVQWIAQNTPTQVFGGQVVQNIWFTIQNTSAFTWVAHGPNAVHLSYHITDAAGRTVVWEGARSGLPGNIAPGQETTFLGSIIYPSRPGYYTLYWDLVQEGMTWFSQQGCERWALTIHVLSPRIVVDKSDHRLYLIQGDTIVKAYPVAVGKPSTPTPNGKWIIGIKTVRSMTAPMSCRHMRLFRWNGAGYLYTGYAIHGTPWPWTIGTDASHGCIRMYNWDVAELYDLVEVGTEVITQP